jgi:hypothetical protein
MMQFAWYIACTETADFEAAVTFKRSLYAHFMREAP